MPVLPFGCCFGCSQMPYRTAKRGNQAAIPPVPPATHLPPPKIGEKRLKGSKTFLPNERPSGVLQPGAPTSTGDGAQRESNGIDGSSPLWPRADEPRRCPGTRPGGCWPKAASPSEWGEGLLPREGHPGVFGLFPGNGATPAGQCSPGQPHPSPPPFLSFLPFCYLRNEF